MLALRISPRSGTAALRGARCFNSTPRVMETAVSPEKPQKASNGPLKFSENRFNPQKLSIEDNVFEREKYRPSVFTKLLACALPVGLVVFLYYAFTLEEEPEGEEWWRKVFENQEQATGSAEKEGN